jgi:Peptidase S24-like
MRHSALFHSVIADGLATGATVRFRAEGDSMYPTIRDGETIAVVAVSASEIVCGDILLCRHGVRLLAHRVVAATASAGNLMFELQGDAKSSCDAPIGAHAVIGKVISVQRNGRSIRLCGAASRMRRAARSAASRTRRAVASTPAIVREVIRRAAPIGSAPRR